MNGAPKRTRCATVLVLTMVGMFAGASALACVVGDGTIADGGCDIGDALRIAQCLTWG
jgi:hypothetical protein